MASKYKIFPIPVYNPEEKEGELNRFLGSHKILTIHKEIVREQSGNYVCFVVEYLTQGQKEGMTEPSKEKNAKKDRVDYKEILSSEDFQLYLRLKDWRKLAGEKQDNAPLYTIFTNEQLAQICEKKVSSKTDLKKIPGIGDIKADNYGEDVIKIISEHLKGISNETVSVKPSTNKGNTKS